MPNFHFRLATLLRLRETERDERRLELAEVQREDDILLGQLNLLHEEWDLLKKHCRKAAGPGPLDVERLREGRRYELALRAEEQRLTAERARLAEEIERRRAALAAADQEVKTLEKLRERQAARHRLEEDRRAIRQWDEIAGQQAAAAAGRQ
jgi:flagellar protein FliJ